MGVYVAKYRETVLDGEGADSPFAIAVARDVGEPRREVRKLFDIVRDDVWEATKPSGPLQLWRAARTRGFLP